MRRVIAYPPSVLFFFNAELTQRVDAPDFQADRQEGENGIFQQLPTEEIAESVTPGSSGNSARSVRIVKGSVLNNVKSRTRGYQQRVGSAFVSAGQGLGRKRRPFIWDAILDEVTCALQGEGWPDQATPR